MKKWLLVGVLLLFLSCSQNVVTYTNSKAKFQNFSSYQIVNVKIGKRKLPAAATELLGTIESQIRIEMEERRNYVSSNVKPDLILRYELASNTRTGSNTRNNALLQGPSFGSNVIYESVILIELLENKRLIWQGSYDLNQSRREARNENTINKAISLIFTTYPYKAGIAEPDLSLTSKKKK